MPRARKPLARSERYIAPVTIGDLGTPESERVVRAPITHNQFEIEKAAALPGRPCWEYLTSRSDDGRMWAPPFAALGAEGWELVAVYRTGDALYAPAYYAVFKRETK